MTQLGFLWYSFLGNLWTATVQMTQHTKLQNVDLSAPKRGPQIKIWQLIWNQGPKLSIIANFEGPTLNNKNLKISTFRRAEGQSGGLKTKIFNWYEIRTPKLVYQILKDLHWKKILKLWPFGGLGSQTGAPNQKFLIGIKSGPQNECHIKFWIEGSTFKNKILKFWPFGGPGGLTGAPTQNF